MNYTTFQQKKEQLAKQGILFLDVFCGVISKKQLCDWLEECDNMCNVIAIITEYHFSRKKNEKTIQGVQLDIEWAKSGYQNSVQTLLKQLVDDDEEIKIEL